MYHFVAMLRRCVRVDHYQQVGCAPGAGFPPEQHHMFCDFDESMRMPWKQTVQRWRMDFLSILSKQI